MTDTLERFAADIGRPDQDARTAARERQAVLTKPAGSLGRLEELSIWLAGVQGVCPTRPLEQVRVVVFAGDHGVATTGVSAYPPKSPRRWCQRARRRRSRQRTRPARRRQVRVVDMAVDADPATCPLPSRSTKYAVGSGRSTSRTR